MIVESHEMLCLLFIESTDYEDRMLYLQGLSNLELKQSLDYLAPIIVGQPPSDHHIQFLATWAVLNTAHANPNKVLCYNNTGTRLVNTRCVILHQQLIQGLAKQMDGKEGCSLFYLYKLGDTSTLCEPTLSRTADSLILTPATTFRTYLLQKSAIFSLRD